ncbi:MAG: hypothetical protein HYT65_02235 [Candidatus Yanofskybacteria bacterium]|nr:hypothetical protein [Candidatus Yanofskybacteria bacterium]
MKGILVFDMNCGPGSFLGHSQMWCVNLPNGRYHIESRIRRSLFLPDFPREVKITPCDGSCFKTNIPDEVAEIVKQKVLEIAAF